MSTIEAEIHLQYEGPNKNTYMSSKGNAVLVVCIQGSEDDFPSLASKPWLKVLTGANNTREMANGTTLGTLE